MKKIVLLFVVLFSFSSCLDSDDDTNIVDRFIAFDIVKINQNTVKVNQRFYAYAEFNYNPKCESLYSQYYYSVNDFERVIAPIAQVIVNNTCSDSAYTKKVTDSIPFKFKRPGNYTIKFYNGNKEGTDSATFITENIIVEN